MPKRDFPNQLRTIRKRSGLSQDEAAFLLEGENGGMISRYEQFNRMPSLETACALGALFGIPVKDLFVGTFEKMSRTLAKRVLALEKELKTPNGLSAHKLKTLHSVSAALNTS